MAVLLPLDEVVGPVVATLQDGTEYRQVQLNPEAGETHQTPDGRTWVAVREEVVGGTVVDNIRVGGSVITSPLTIHWKGRVAPIEPNNPLEFLEKAQKDPGLSARVLAAVERGNRVTAEEVLQLSHEFGYSFGKEEFEATVRRNIADRFAAGDKSLADVADPLKAMSSPESSCPKGCLSYTKTWHATVEVVEA